MQNPSASVGRKALHTNNCFVHICYNVLPSVVYGFFRFTLRLRTVAASIYAQYWDGRESERCVRNRLFRRGFFVRQGENLTVSRGITAQVSKLNGKNSNATTGII